ncbi:MAG: hypothetical protein IJ574_04405 [Bacilli bacterium]|nr:hypothetical protein [Bacilli bacterium]
MAKNLKDDIERNRRVDLVGKYYLKGYSIREIVNYFNEQSKVDSTFFKTSTSTVSDYLKRYQERYNDLKIEKLKAEHKSTLSLSVNMCASMIVELIPNLEISDIAVILNCSEHTVYNYIHKVIPNLYPDRYKGICEILNKRSMSNLNKKR